MATFGSLHASERTEIVNSNCQVVTQRLDGLTPAPTDLFFTSAQAILTKKDYKVLSSKEEASQDYLVLGYQESPEYSNYCEATVELRSQRGGVVFRRTRTQKTWSARYCSVSNTEDLLKSLPGCIQKP